MNNLSFIDEELELLVSAGLKRELKTVLTASGPWVEISGGKRVLQFGSNNYLGLSNHPEVINASKAAVSKYGAGSTGSRLLSGTTELHTLLEKALALFEHSESALFFSSGYSANVGLLSALIGKEDIVYSDELNHASIIDGIRLSGASKFIYNHNDISHLEKLINESMETYNRRSFIVTDTVFSMDGDIAPLKEIGLVAEKYNLITIVDEAHATGVFGKKGNGVIEELNLENYFPIKIGTCSKAMGVEGGFCCGPKNLIELLQNKARSFMFSTSPSPQVTGAVLKSLELVIDSEWRRERLWNNAKLLYSGLKKIYKLKLGKFQSPIISVYFNNIEEAILISNKLFNECHIWAPVIRPPTVKQPRIRLTPISPHSEEDIKYVVKAFEYLAKDIKAEPLGILN
ncbi:MAG: pyridoxal phosphate-dependent aminotransferase family protein [Candidatus Melainabacteria bacterium]|nr:pyridoxal phosphate-dependent aminotransferase family protein [Candidatus Melainabacteria bacterium]